MSRRRRCKLLTHQLDPALFKSTLVFHSFNSLKVQPFKAVGFQLPQLVYHYTKALVEVAKQQWPEEDPTYIDRLLAGRSVASQLLGELKASALFHH